MEIKEIGKWDLMNVSEVYFDQVFLIIIAKGDEVSLRSIENDNWTAVGVDKESQKLCRQRFCQFRVCAKESVICGLGEDEKIVGDR